MKEYMLLIRNVGDAKAGLSPDEHHNFVKACEKYISELQDKQQLIAAQPIVREGFVISKSSNEWTEIAINTQSEIQVGYYHILAKDMDEAVAIAKRNPEFEYVNTASIEVRPIKTKEQSTQFVYPK